MRQSSPTCRHRIDTALRPGAQTVQGLPLHREALRLVAPGSQTRRVSLGLEGVPLAHRLLTAAHRRGRARVGCIGVPRLRSRLSRRGVRRGTRTSPSSTAGFRPIAHLSNWGTGRQTQHGLTSRTAGLVTSCLAAPPTKHHPGGRARASATSGEGEGPTRSPPPARLVYVLDSRRGSCGHLAQFEANGESPYADLEGLRDRVRERTRESRGPQHRQPVGDLASDRVGPVGAVRRTRARDTMATPTALILDAPAGA